MKKKFINLMTENLKINQIRNLLTNKQQEFYKLPIVISGQKSEVLDIEACMKDVCKFISYLVVKANIDLKIECNIKKVRLDISNSSMYQIIFSLMFNIIDFVLESSSISISVNKGNDMLLFQLKYTGFGLLKSDILKLKKHKKHINPYLLDWRTLFDVMKLHELEIIFTKSDTGGSIKLSKVLNFGKVYNISEYRNQP